MKRHHTCQQAKKAGLSPLPRFPRTGTLPRPARMRPILSYSYLPPSPPARAEAELIADVSRYIPQTFVVTSIVTVVTTATAAAVATIIAAATVVTAVTTTTAAVAAATTVTTAARHRTSRNHLPPFRASTC